MRNILEGVTLVAGLNYAQVASGGEQFDEWSFRVLFGGVITLSALLFPPLYGVVQMGWSGVRRIDP